eukprot:9713310-Lingulodinium_polyedra.AAC.1
MRQGAAQDIGAIAVAEDIHDALCGAMCFALYKWVLVGNDFTQHTEGLEFVELVGAKLVQSRRRRMFAQQV